MAWALTLLKDAFFFIWIWMNNWPFYIMQGLWACVPEPMQASALPYMQPLLDGMVVLNHWFPISECLSAAATLFTFRITFITVKIILKLLPFIG
jgi:hypothetical protein